MILRGDKTWPFVAKFIGTIFVDNVVATWFGGDVDPQDNGQTACGYPTKGHPDLLGCSLPMDLGTERATDGSPIPRLPWGLHSDGTLNPDGTIVTVWPFGFPDQVLPLPLIDDGPGKQATKNPAEPHAIDLTRAAFSQLAAFAGLKPAAALRAGIIRVGYKIVAT
jgi:hypothetical protein